ncbi:class I SAM-dependent methyltransferase [Cloacibacillus porcorum]|uniref:class I SAM-dependent methyltransferase n=2 Tax=Cloacibacillus porcorum TaxID=1197717 RepID=UPI002A90A20E|nr:class I SAM-dependent methyltransferase [Cloacibacillus porcorum]MDY5389734.1 class I SAM-dependent methyltransferase [Cloacibacillus porcorum]
MTMKNDLNTRPCPICDDDDFDVLYASTLNSDSFTPEIFSARRIPDRLHGQFVKCNTCGCVYVNPVTDVEFLSDLYEKSKFTYGPIVDDIQRTYLHYFKKALAFHPLSKGSSLMEIGCGNAFFLEGAHRLGVDLVYGVEPSSDAIANASNVIRPQIINDIFRPGLFSEQSLDYICAFQVADHLPHPKETFRECFRILKRGAVLLCLNHNVDAVSAKVLGERSPIFDIEHTISYSPKTMTRLLQGCGFTIVNCGTAYNKYNLPYLLHLFPFSNVIKRNALFKKFQSINNIKLPLPLGNLFMIAQKQ